LTFQLRAWEQLREYAPVDAVHSGGRSFEAGTVGDGDLAAALSDQSRLPERVADHVHVGAQRAQRHGQGLLRQIDRVGLRTPYVMPQRALTQFEPDAKIPMPSVQPLMTLAGARLRPAWP
jgi:hypothetical protein